jgi:hypothetical protein
VEATVKNRGPSAALRRHVKWLRDLQKDMRDEREQYEAEEKEEEARKQKMKVDFEKHRTAVKEMMVERDNALEQEHKAIEKMKQETRKAMQKGHAKPLWAMTEEEKDDFEEEAAEDLIGFAENLDYEKFLGDLEFRHGLEALRDRTGKLKKEQEAFKEALVKDFNAANEEEQSTEAPGSPRNLDGIDGTSLVDSEISATSSRRRARAAARLNSDGRPEWDSSTVAGDEKAALDDKVKDDATRVLESNSQIRAVHSQASVQKMLEKAKEKAQQPLSLQETMARDGQMPAPVITASEDTQARLNKPVDPSQLPYLYRSPAV